jgi:hypothetical protein
MSVPVEKQGQMHISEWGLVRFRADNHKAQQIKLDAAVNFILEFLAVPPWAPI